MGAFLTNKRFFGSGMITEVEGKELTEIVVAELERSGCNLQIVPNNHSSDFDLHGIQDSVSLHIDVCSLGISIYDNFGFRTYKIMPKDKSHKIFIRCEESERIKQYERSLITLSISNTVTELANRKSRKLYRICYARTEKIKSEFSY